MEPVRQASPNLQLMKTISVGDRATIARGWEKSGQRQDEYAARFGIAGRTLRLWLDRYASRQPPLAQARAILADAVERLKALLAALDADPACRPEPEGDQGASDPVCRLQTQGTADGGRPDKPEDRPERRDVVTALDADLATAMSRVQAELAKLAAPGAPREAATSTSAQPRPRPKKSGGFFADAANWS